MSTPLSSSDPNDLPNLARCFSCYVPPGMQTAVRNYITANIAVVATNPVCTAPSAPTGVSASNARVADPNTQMNVRWLQPANPGSFITGYIVSWGTTMGGPYPNSATVPITPKNFTATGLTPGTTYFFVVQALAFAGCVSANSNEATGTTSGAAPACVAGTAFATAWAARVVVNGGANPTAAEQLAVANFQCGLITDGLDTLMLSWNAFVSSSLIGAITPQLKGATNDPWTNNGPFVAGDLTVAGLIGDGIAKYLNTGTTGQGFYGNNVPNNNAGHTAYVTVNTDPVGTSVLTGASDGGASLDALEMFGGNTKCFLFDVASTISAANAGFTGYVSANRVALNSLAIYEGNSGVPHHTLVSGAVNNTGGGSAIVTYRVFAYADNTGTSLFANQRLGLVIFHLGLSSAQSALLFARVQTFMTALGRAI